MLRTGSDRSQHKNHLLPLHVAGLQITLCTLGKSILIRSQVRSFRLICLAVADGYLLFSLAGMHGKWFSCWLLPRLSMLNLDFRGCRVGPLFCGMELLGWLMMFLESCWWWVSFDFLIRRGALQMVCVLTPTPSFNVEFRF